MAYKTPKVVAKSAKKSSYVAGCPAKGTAGQGSLTCRQCERSG